MTVGYYSGKELVSNFFLLKLGFALKQKCVLIPHFLDGSQYIKELGRAYQAHEWQVIYGRDNLLEISAIPDMVHLHWPESIYRWGVAGSAESQAKRLIESIQKMKLEGAKIIWTVQNLKPHDSEDDELDSWVYQRFIDLSDLIVHHCRNSIQLLSQKYRLPEGTPNIVVPRGGFDSIPNLVSKEQARKKLSLPPDSFVYLHFGYVRPYKGLFSILRAFLKAKVKNKVFLVAGSYQAARGQWPRLDLIFLKILSTLDSRIRLNLFWIEDSQIQYYMSASDCVVLGYFSGLNSGVAAIGMKFGRLVIGPRAGCVGELLESGINLTYDSRDHEALVKSMEKAADIDFQLVETTNKSISATWSWSFGVKTIVDAIFSKSDQHLLQSFNQTSRLQTRSD